MPDRDEFLRRVDSALPFLAEQRAPVIEELRGHLDESVAALIDQGWDPVAAHEEALRRMGDPAELAAGIGKARQTRRRLLAAAGAGVLNAGGSMIGITLLLVPAAILAYALVSLLAMPFGLSMFDVMRSNGVAYAVVILWLTVAVVGLRLPLALARAARRPIRWGRRVACVTLLPVVTFWVVAVVHQPYTIASVVAYLATPVIAFVAIRRSGETRRSSSLRRIVLGLALIILAAVAIDTILPSPAGTELELTGPAYDADPISLNLGLVGQLDLAKDEDVPGFGWSGGADGYDLHVPVSPEQAARFPHLSAELWPATPDLGAIHPDATGALVSADVGPGELLEWTELSLLGGRFLYSPRQDPAIAQDWYPDSELLVGTLRFDGRRDWGPGVGWMVLVATDEDGMRHVLRWGDVSRTIGFRGTMLEWFLADPSPAPLNPA